MCDTSASPSALLVVITEYGGAMHNADFSGGG